MKEELPVPTTTTTPGPSSTSSTSASSPPRKAPLVPTLSAALANSAQISNKITLVSPTKESGSDDGDKGSGADGGVDDEDEAETAVAALLPRVVRLWPGRLVRSFPLGVDRLSECLRLHLPSLVSDRAAAAASSPAAVSEDCVRAAVSVSDVEVAKGKKRFKLSFVVRSAALGGQRCTLRCREDGASDGEARFFVESAEEDRVEVEVWKNGERCLGRAEFNLGKGGGALKLTSGSSKTGTVTVSAAVFNKEKPTATTLVRKKLSRDLCSNLGPLFAAYPKVVEALKEAHDREEGSCANSGSALMRVEQEVLFETGEGAMEDTAVALNGKELLEWRLDGGVSVFSGQVEDLGRDAITVSRHKRMKASPLLQRKTSTSSNKSENVVAIGALKQSVANVLKIPSPRKASLDEDGGGGSGSSSPSYRLMFSEEVPVSEVFFQQGGKAVQNKGVRWKFRWQLEEEGLRKEEEQMSALKSLYRVLLEGLLGRMSPEERAAWEGGLGAAREELLGLVRLMCLQGTEFSKVEEKARARALLELHEKFEFNDFVAQEALATLANRGEDLRRLPGTVKYLRKVARTLAAYEAGKVFKEEEKRLRYATAAVQLVEKATGEDFFCEAFSRYFDCVLRDQVAHRFTSPDLAQVKREAESFAIPTAREMRRNLGDFTSCGVGGIPLHSCFVRAVLDQAVPVVRNVVLAERADPELSFNLFRVLRELLDLGGSVDVDRRAYFFSAFEPCLPAWAETVKAKAMEQVGRVLAIERERHAEQSWEGFYEATAPGEEWFESAMHVGGIFRSCEVTWKKLDWPDVKRNLDFGIELSKKLLEVLQYFITCFFDIIYEDLVFDKVELVIILSSISLSSEYLVDMFGDLNDFLFTGKQKKVGGGGEQQQLEEKHDEEVMQKVRQFSALCSRASALAESRSGEFVTLFCQGEGDAMDKYVGDNRIFNEEDEEDCLLGHLNRVLRFLDQNMRLASDKATARYNRLVQERLFEVVDKKIVEHHVKLGEVIKARLDRGVARRAFTAVEELIRFRSSLGLEENPDLRRIRETLRVQGMPTHSLISEHLREVHRRLGESDSNPMGELCFDAGFVHEEVMLVILRSLRGAKPRKGKTTCNSSVTVRLFTRSGSWKGVTAVHQDSSDVLFDLQGPEEKQEEEGSLPAAGDESVASYEESSTACAGMSGGHVFTFRAVSGETEEREEDGGGEDEAMLLIELYDHSFAKTHKIYADIKLQASDLELKKLASRMRLNGDLYKFEVDAISGKVKVKWSKGDYFTVITDKDQLLQHASRKIN